MNEADDISDRSMQNEPRQFGLGKLLLLVAAAAVWFSTWRVHREINVTQGEIELLRSFSKELVVTDETQFAMNYQDAIWEGERRCKIYLPPKHSYELHVALEGKYHVTPPTGAIPVKSIKLAPGEHTVRHFILTRQDGLTEINVYCDDQLIYGEVHEVGWLPVNYAYLEKMDEPFRTIQRDVDEPLEIWRGVSQHPEQSGFLDRVRGLILWVERE